MFEGQQAEDPYSTQVSDEVQPSVEAIEQFTLQTSNFSAEYGGVGGGGIYNFTSKSGTNQYHGSVYNYMENTILNAGDSGTNIFNSGDARVINAATAGNRHAE